jgi:hypothetical protein
MHRTVDFGHLFINPYKYDGIELSIIYIIQSKHKEVPTVGLRFFGLINPI